MFGRFTGQFMGANEEEAVKEAKDFYDHELDTFLEDIKIVSIEQI